MTKYKHVVINIIAVLFPTYAESLSSFARRFFTCFCLFHLILCMSQPSTFRWLNNLSPISTTRFLSSIKLQSLFQFTNCKTVNSLNNSILELPLLASYLLVVELVQPARAIVVVRRWRIGHRDSLSCQRSRVRFLSINTQ